MKKLLKLENVLGDLDASWERLGTSWERLGSILGASWSVLECLGSVVEPLLEVPGDKVQDDRGAPFGVALIRDRPSRYGAQVEVVERPRELAQEFWTWDATSGSQLRLRTMK